MTSASVWRRLATPLLPYQSLVRSPVRGLHGDPLVGPAQVLDRVAAVGVAHRVAGGERGRGDRRAEQQSQDDQPRPGAARKSVT